jgi:hypothetical protein
MKNRLPFLLLAILWSFSMQASAAIIEHTLHSLGGAQYRYDYTVRHQAGEAPILLLDIDFDPALYLESSLNIVSDPVLNASWDQLIIGSQPGYPALFDVFALGTGLDNGDVLTGLAVEFTWLGAGLPGAQAFTLLDPTSFDVIDSGFTRAASSNVPEPGGIAFVVFLLLLFAAVMKYRYPGQTIR